MMRAALLTTLCLLLASPPAAAVFGAVKEDDPYAIRVRELEAKVERMERVLENQSLLQLLNELDALKAEVSALRGETELLRNDVDGLQRRQRELYLDVDRRLQRLELGGAAAATNADATQGNQAKGSGGDREAYQAAFELLRQARYSEAANAFNSMLSTFPDSALAANARYWLGETKYVNREFASAINEFRTVLERFPESNKVPDALLKIGYCYFELKDWDNSRAALQAVMQRFPGHQAAEQAGKRLERLPQQ